MPRVMVWAPEVPPGSHPLADMDDICFPMQLLLDVADGWAVPPVDTRYPFNSWVN